MTPDQLAQSLGHKSHEEWHNTIDLMETFRKFMADLCNRHAIPMNDLAVAELKHFYEASLKLTRV